MKTIIMFLALFVGLTLSKPLMAQQDAITTYFNKYVEDDRFTVVFVSPKMFQMIRSMNIKMDMTDNQATAITEVVKEMQSIRILTSEQDGRTLYKEALNTINTKGYETLISVKSPDSNVQFLVKETGNVISELLLLVGDKSANTGKVDDSEFVMMSFIGRIDITKIGKLAKAFEED